MSKPGDSICMTDVVLRLLRRRWATHILTVIASHQAIHFNELKRAIPGISAKALTTQLRFLETAGVLERHVSGGARHEVSYAYTTRGHELKRVGAKRLARVIAGRLAATKTRRKPAKSRGVIDADSHINARPGL